MFIRDTTGYIHLQQSSWRLASSNHFLRIVFFFWVITLDLRKRTISPPVLTPSLRSRGFFCRVLTLCLRMRTISSLVLTPHLRSRGYFCRVLTPSLRTRTISSPVLTQHLRSRGFFWPGPYSVPPDANYFSTGAYPVSPVMRYFWSGPTCGCTNATILDLYSWTFHGSLFASQLQSWNLVWHNSLKEESPQT